MSHDPSSLSPPPARALLGELRTVLDLVGMLAPLSASRLRRAPPAPSRTIVVLPGIGTDDRVTAPLRYYLRRHGYDAQGWGLGRNVAGLNIRHQLRDIPPGWLIEEREDYRGEGSVPMLCDRFVTYLKTHYGARQVALVGWSLGGYVAREAARELPEQVSQVITLGAPTIGGPKYTRAAAVFAERGMDMDWIESVIAEREATPIRQPITAIFSRSDGIVDWRASQDHHSPNVRHLEVSAAHLGMVFSARVWREVRRALQGFEATRSAAG